MYGLIANGRSIAAGFHAALSDHIRNPDIWLNPNELDRTETKVIGGTVAVPLAIGRLGLFPRRETATTKPLPQPPRSLQMWATILLPLA